MTIHLDISQLIWTPPIGHPAAERELIRHWPGPAPLVPCRFDPATNTMEALPAAVFDILCADGPAGGADEESRLLQALLRQGPPRRAPIVPARLLNAELFPDAGRRISTATGLPIAAPTGWSTTSCPGCTPTGSASVRQRG